MIICPFENEWFAREDAERLRKLAHRLRKQIADAERERLRELHWMRCPRCGLELHEVAFRGMRTEVCPDCHGLFVDERELAHLQAPEAHGVMSGILNWFRPELKG